MHYKKVIDVSKFNEISGTLDDKSIDGIMIRATSGMKKDVMLEEHLDNAIEHGVPFGFYFYTAATTRKDLVEELKYFHTVCNKVCAAREKWAKLPMAIDVEYTSDAKFRGVKNEEFLSMVLYTAKDYFEKEGIPWLVYMNYDFFVNRCPCSMDIVPQANRWVARYRGVNTEMDIRRNCGIDAVMWQYGQEAIGDGERDIDCNLANPLIFAEYRMK